MSARVNWSGIGGIIKTLFTVGAVISIPAFVFSCVKNEVENDNKLKEANVVTQSDTTYTLVDSDSVRMDRNKLIYFFNFNMRHLTIKGKINDYNLDTTFTFDQYTDQTRINEIREQACTLARNFSTMALNEETPSNVRNGHAAATAFAANHCPQPTPRNG